jgi:hypothetical protein
LALIIVAGMDSLVIAEDIVDDISHILLDDRTCGQR